MIRILTLLFCVSLSSCLWAQGSPLAASPKAVENKDDTIRLRKLFVPSDQIQEFIRGKFLPIESERFEQFLKSQEVDAENEFMNAVVDLTWSNRGPLSGFYLFETQTDPVKSPVFIFDSNLVFGDIQPSVKNLDQVFVGTRTDGSKIFQSLLGGRIESEVTLLESERKNVFRFRLPPTESPTTVFLNVPKEWGIRSDVVARQVHTCAPADFTGDTRLYRLFVPGDDLTVAMAQAADETLVIESETQIRINDFQAEMSVKGVIENDVPISQEFVFDLPNEFTCTGIRLGQREVPFRHLLATKRKRSISFDLPANLSDGSSTPFQITAVRDVQRTDTIQMRPVVFQNALVVDKQLLVTWEGQWKIDQLDLSGFHVSASELGQLKLISVVENPVATATVSRKESQPASTSLTVNTFENRITVQQGLENVTPWQVLEIKPGWKVISVTSPLFDNEPVSWKLQESNARNLVALSDGPAELLVTAEQNIDLRKDYSFDDFVPFQIRNQACEVRIGNSFVSSVAANVAAPFGLNRRNDSESATPTIVDYATVRHLRFSFPAEREKYGSSFSYTSELVIEGDALKSRSILEWDASKNSQILFELDTKKLPIRWEGINGKALAHRLTRFEKRLLGLNESLEFWSLQEVSQGPPQLSRIQFIQEFDLATSPLEIEFPQPVQNGTADGLVRLKGFQDDALDLQTINLREVPSVANLSNNRTFETRRGSALILSKSSRPYASELLVEVRNRRLEFFRTGRVELQLDVLLEFNGESSLVIESGIPLESVSVRTPYGLLTARNVIEDWQVDFSAVSGSRIEATLILNWRSTVHDSPTMVTLPEIRLNDVVGDGVDLAINVDRSFEAIPLGELFSSETSLNSRAISLLPWRLFEASTDFTSPEVDRNRPNPRLPTNALNQYLLIPGHMVLLAGFVISGIFSGFTLQSRRIPGILVIGSLMLVAALFLSYGLALIASFAVFGVIVGLILRELRRLCRIVRLHFSWLLILALPIGTLTGQDDKVVEATAAEPIIYPIDTDGKPSGLVYLPLKVYDLVTGSVAKQQVACRSFEINLLESSTNDRIVFHSRFHLVVSNPTKVVLPFYLQNAVFPEDAVSVNGTPVTFRLDDAAQTIETESVRNGEVQLEITALIRIGLEDTKVVLPFTNCGAVKNKTETTFELSAIRSTPIGTLPVGDTLRLGDVREFGLKWDLAGNPEVKLHRLINLNSMESKERVLITLDRPLEKDLVLEFPDRLKLKENNLAIRLSQSNGIKTATIPSSASTRFELEFEPSEQTHIGFFRLQPISVLSHDPSEYQVAVTAEEDLDVQKWSTNITDASRENFVRFWNQNSDFEIPIPLFAIPGDSCRGCLFMGVRRPSRRSGKTTYHHFVSGQSHRVRMNVVLTSQTSMDSIAFNLLEDFHNISVKLGESDLLAIRTGPGNYLTPLNALSPGQYEFTISADSPLPSGKIPLEILQMPNGTLESSHLIWCDRERVVDVGELKLAEIPTVEDGYFLVGEALPGSSTINTSLPTAVASAQLLEKVKFDNGRLHHTVTINPAQLATLGWAGINIPYEAKNIDCLPVFFFQVEESRTFSRKQVWIPLNPTTKSPITISFDTNITAQGIATSSLENVRSLQRTLELPRQIGVDRLNWDLPKTNLQKSDPSSQVYRINNSTTRVKYTLDQKLEINPIVDFSESVFDPDSKRLRSRFYITPNGANNCQIALPARTQLRSVTVCGQNRRFQRLPDHRVEFDLLDSQLCQFVDLVLDAQSLSVKLPEFTGWQPGPHMIQLTEHQGYRMVSGERQMPYSDVVLRRREFLDKAIGVYELNANKRGESRWNLVNWHLMLMAGMDPSSTEEALGVSIAAYLDDGELIRSGIPQFEELITAEEPIHLLENNAFKAKGFTNDKAFNQKTVALAVMILSGVLIWMFSLLHHSAFLSVYSFSIVALLWLTGISWISVSPTSILGWCLSFLALLMAILFAFYFIFHLREWRSWLASRRMEQPST